MLYVSRQLAVDAPDIPLVVQTSRWDRGGPLKHLTAAFGLGQFVARLAGGRIGVAHINVAPRASTFRKMAFARAARLFGAKTILHLHGSGYDGFLRRLPGPIGRRTIAFFQRADRVVVLGDYWHRFALDELGVSPERLVVVENGVPAAATLADPRHDPPLITFMGNVGTRKGVDVLIAALSRLSADGVPFRARIGGNGEVDHYRRAAQAAGIADRTEFLGWLGEDDVARNLEESDIFVLPSRAENQPVSILEAMARGLPVVASSVGAIPEQVLDGDTGFIVPPGDPDALAAALERLCRDANLRVRLGANGLARWRERYSLEVTASRFAALYRQLLD